MYGWITLNGWTSKPCRDRARAGNAAGKQNMKKEPLRYAAIIRPISPAPLRVVHRGLTVCRSSIRADKPMNILLRPDYSVSPHPQRRLGCWQPNTTTVKLITNRLIPYGMGRFFMAGTNLWVLLVYDLLAREK